MKRHKMMLRMTWLAGPATVVALLPAIPAAALGPSWGGVPPIPLPGSAGTTGSATLRGVSAISGKDIWAVGSWSDAATHPLAAHWNGAAWTVAATGRDGGQNSFAAVDAVASDDVWVAGSTTTATATDPMVMHYNGSGWAVLPTPTATGASHTSQLKGIGMVSAADGWAVGSTSTAGGLDQPLILRWQGDRWTPVTFTLPGAVSGALTSVSARTANDVWAIGSQVLSTVIPTALVMHWDGATWQSISVPVATGTQVTLASIAALSAGEVWVVGKSCVTVVNHAKWCTPVVLRLFGGAWSVVTSDSGAELTGVAPRSSTDVWVTGYSGDAPAKDADFAEHWDGQRFTADPTGPVGSQSDGQPGSALEAAAVTPDTGEVLAVGWAGGGTQLVHEG